LSHEGGRGGPGSTPGDVSPLEGRERHVPGSRAGAQASLASGPMATPVPAHLRGGQNGVGVVHAPSPMGAWPGVSELNKMRYEKEAREAREMLGRVKRRVWLSVVLVGAVLYMEFHSGAGRGTLLSRLRTSPGAEWPVEAKLLLTVSTLLVFQLVSNVCTGGSEGGPQTLSSSLAVLNLAWFIIGFVACLLLVDVRGFQSVGGDPLPGTTLQSGPPAAPPTSAA